MSKTNIPQKVQSALWARSGGRCQYSSCNKLLIGDLISGRQDPLFGYIAHIVADRADGPRGDITRSPLLAKDLGNLMLMCPVHHKLIDVDDVDGHPEARLLAMKRAHEARIEVVTGIHEDRASHVIRFGADIAHNEALVDTRSIFMAMPPEHHPADGRTIDLELVGSAFADHEPEYWTFQKTNLDRQFAAQVKGRIERQEIRHLSVFALAPQPLLIELGRLLGDIAPAAVRQRHREPPTWEWQRDGTPIVLQTAEPLPGRPGPVALKLAISATVMDERIEAVLGPNAAIWSLSAASPGLDVLRRPEDQVAYRQHLRELLDRIKTVHGEDVVINVFPALPVSLAVETGRVWMAKADLPMKIYDQNRSLGGFVPTFEIR